MTRIKTMLTAIGVLAVVGGALAFKAKKFGALTYCTTTLGGGAACNVLRLNTSFTTTVGAGAVKYIRVFVPNCNTLPQCTATGIPEG